MIPPGLTREQTLAGNQRVAIMYDLDWIRAKDDITELSYALRSEVMRQGIF